MMGEGALKRVRFVITADCAEMTPNRKMHYRERDRLRDKWKLLARDGWNGAKGRMFARRVRISYFAYRGREMDERNLAASYCFKAIEDALIGLAYPDDSPRYVESGRVGQITAVQFRRAPLLEVIIEEIPEEKEINDAIEET